MSKNRLMGLINSNYNACLNNNNTSFSNINKSKEVWWFNVPLPKFLDDVHLLLNTRDFAYWIYLPKGFADKIEMPFKVREDRGAIDLEISADRGFKYLKDVKSGGKGFDFEPYVKEKIEIGKI